MIISNIYCDWENFVLKPLFIIGWNSYNIPNSLHSIVFLTKEMSPSYIIKWAFLLFNSIVKKNQLPCRNILFSSRGPVCLHQPLTDWWLFHMGEHYAFVLWRNKEGGISVNKTCKITCYNMIIWRHKFSGNNVKQRIWFLSLNPL